MEKTIPDHDVHCDDLWRYELDARDALNQRHEPPDDDEPDWDEREDAGVTDDDTWPMNG